MERTAKIMAVLGLLVLCGSVLAVDGNEPIAHWKFDEGSGTMAYDSAGSNDGTVHGAYWTSGQIDGALSFDGVNDYVEIGSAFASVTESPTKTIMAWAKSDTTDYSSQGRIITLYMERGWTSVSISAKGDPATWQGLYRKAADVHQWFDSGVSVTANEWTHVALVQDGANVYIYINGVLENSASDAAVPTIRRLVNTNIGAFRAGNGGMRCFFSGAIDDVRIYNRALSAEEIEQIYVQGLNLHGSEIAIIYIENAIAEKEEMLEVIDEALEKEDKAYAALEELLESRDYGDLSKRDIVKAKKKIHSAIQREEKSAGGLEKSIERLYDALLALGWEPEPNLPEPEPNLISHWKFDEGSGTTAYDSAGTNNGTIYGAIWTTGQIDGALSFDGANDYVQVSDDDSLTDGSWSGLTMSAWVCINSISWDDRAGIVLKYYALDRDRAYMMNLGKNNDDTDNSSVGITVSQTRAPFNGKVTFGTTQLQAGQWYHIATTWEADHQEVYVNGVEETDDTDSAIANSIPNNNLPLYVGYQKGENTYFNGTIDDVRIYDRALSAEEIQQLYQDGL